MIANAYSRRAPCCMTALATFAFLALHAAPAAAQGAVEEEPVSQGAGDIIVTAQKRAEKLNDVPLSVTAATGDQLSERGVFAPADLERIVPGFTFVKSSYGAPIYTIRGIGVYDEALAVAPTVSIYVDQVPLPFGRMTEGAALDVERVEALKGPQGTLFGQNSTGGAVNYVAAKPTEEFEWGGDLTFARFNTIEAQGYVSGPLADGVAARLAVRTEQGGDWQKSYTRKDSLGERHFTTARLLLDIEPTDTLKLTFNVNGWKNRSDTQAGQFQAYAPTNPFGYTDAPGFPNLTQTLQNYPVAPRNNRAADWDEGVDFDRDDRFYQLSLRGDLELSDLITLTSITAWSDLKVDSFTDADGTDVRNLHSNLIGRLKSFSQELRLAGSFASDERLRWMIGANYQYDTTADQQHNFFNGTNSGFSSPTITQRFEYNILESRQKIDTRAVFASLDVPIAETLTLQGAVRYTRQERDFRGCIINPADGIFGIGFGLLSNLLNGVDAIPQPGDPSYIGPGDCATLDSVTSRPVDEVLNKLDEDNVSWRVSLNWKPTEDVLLYANVTKGYKAGSFGTLPLIRPEQSAPVTQEALLAYEAGFKASALDQAVNVTGALFYYDYKNKQLLGYLQTGVPFGNLPGLVSIPKSRVQGAELDITLTPVDGLTLKAGGTYVDSKVTDHFLTAGPLGGDAQLDIKGDPFPNTPKWQLLGDAQYEFPVSSDWSAFLGAGASYRSSTLSFFQGGDDFRQRGYALLDLRAGVESEDGKWRFQIWGRNVTNSYYWVHVSRIQDTRVRLTGMPATYGATVSTRF